MYFPVLLWSLVIFASFWGYGEALRRALKRPEFEDLGWGLTAAWGMAATLAIGGFLMMLSLAKAPMLTGVVLAGAAFALYFFTQRLTSATAPQPASKKSKSKKGKAAEERTLPPAQAANAGYPTVIANILIWGLAALAFASSIAWPHHIDPNDDLVCYLMLPQKILATGTLIEPFSFQRAGTFGGQALLQAMVMIVGNETSGHAPDRGLAMLVIFGILLGVVRGLKMPYALVAFILLFSFWFVPVPRISTNGAMTGGCLLVALLDSLNRLRQSATRATWRSLIPSALLITGACSVRPTYAVVIACIFMALMAACLIHNKSWIERWNDIKPLFIIGILCTGMLIPFMTVLYESNGTPVIPPFSGFVSKAYQTYDHPEFSRNVEALIAFLSVPNTLAILSLFFPVVLFAGVKDRFWMLGGIALACAIIIIRFGALAYLDLYRYIYPILVPVFLWFLAMALKYQGSSATSAGFLRKPATISAASIIALGLFLWPNFNQAWLELRVQAQSLPAQVAENNSFLDPRLRNSYKSIQDAIPKGDKVITMVDASYWLDYSRNPMYSINAVGGSSPPPGIPFHEGSQALLDYFRQLGFKYMIAVDFNNAVLLYTRRLWTTNTRPEWFYPQIWRPRFLDMMNNIDDWDRQGKVIARSGNLRLFDLGK
jgi:hypothetical protein